jgi:ribosomal protein L31E
MLAKTSKYLYHLIISNGCFRFLKFYKFWCTLCTVQNLKTGRQAGRQVQLQFDTRLILIQLALKRKKNSRSLRARQPNAITNVRQQSTSLEVDAVRIQTYVSTCVWGDPGRVREWWGICAIKRPSGQGGSCRRLGKVAGLCRKHVEAWDGSASCQHNAGGPFTACRLAGLFLATAASPRNQLRIVQLTCHLAIARTKNIFEVIQRKVLPLCCACDGGPAKILPHSSK